MKRSGISIDRAEKLRGELRSAIANAFSLAQHFKLTADATRDTIGAAIKHASSRGAPAWVIAYARGYWDARRDEQYLHHFAWVMWCDDKLMTRDEIDALTRIEHEAGLDERHDYRSPWSRIDSDKSRHVWTDDEGNPLRDKPVDERWKEESTDRPLTRL
jgi:hypothetical protein